MARQLVIAAFAIALATLGCSGANPSTGQTALFRVQSTQVGSPQFFSGSIDLQAHADAPVVSTFNAPSNDIFAGGAADKSIKGSVGPGSTAVMLGLPGDIGYWVVPVSSPDQGLPGNFIFSCKASFSPYIPTLDGGGFNLAVRAVDIQGNLGPVQFEPMTNLAMTDASVPDKANPDGALVVRLDWDTEADLDLHVVLPSDGADAGVNEIYSRKPSGLPLATQGATDDEGQAAGYLDFDSNRQCVIDGRRMENVIFPTTAPAGHYIVRVDTFSLCGQVTARWRVQVFTNGTATGLVAYGQSTDTDTRFPHGLGAGVQALAFDYKP